RASSWLEKRIDELRQQAELAERTVVEYKAKNQIISAGTQLVSDQRVAELNSQLVSSREKTSEAKARFDRISAITQSEARDSTDIGAVSDSLNNQIITKLRTQYLELQNREKDWSNRFGANHLAVVNIRRQLSEIRHSIASELGQIAQSYKSDYEIAQQ